MKSAISVIIPAGGASLRFKKTSAGSNKSKIFSRIGNDFLISRVVTIFDQTANVSEIIVALPKKDMVFFKKEVLRKLKLKNKVKLVQGGKTRSESVWNALKKTNPRAKFICVHDAARPCIDRDWPGAMVRCIGEASAIVLGKPVVPTIKEYEPETQTVRRTLDRSRLFEAQTPQIVKRADFFSAYRFLGAKAFLATDDVSLIEAAGGKVKVYSHDSENPKVTAYQDLKWVRSILMTEKNNIRIGLGFDRHKLIANRPFYLGGVRLRAPFGPLGHSDGDPLLHAVTDAILGALALGDIGDHFSDRERQWKDAKSIDFLKYALKLSKEKGFQPQQVDSFVVLQSPKLGPLKKKMEQKVARALGLRPDCVSIKAKTAERLGPEGKSEAVAAEALVVLGRIED